MRNPLRKRLFRELLHDFGKYVVIFTFIFATIAMVAGFLVSDISLKTAYDESFEEYNVEDGHFTLLTPAEDGFFDGMERYYKVKVYENFYADREADDGDAVRVYRLRKDVNRTALWEGDYPSDMGEIAIDRLYAENNGYSVGDTMIIEGRRFRVSGLVALTDYSALFKNNTDMMFDAKQFTVALLSDIDFDVIQPGEMKYCYSWTNDDRALSADECKQKAEDIMDWLSGRAILTDFLRRADNQAIQFTGADMGGDKALITTLLYVVMAVMAFIFAVTTSNTIEQEAAVIGTLRASGYRRGELLRHYIALPIIVSMIAAVLGNLAGYTVLKKYFASLYLHSYSLTPYHTMWSAEAFWLTTVIPLVILVTVNLLVVSRKLRLSPLRFLRRDLSRRGRKRVMHLSHRLRFLSRFRLRVIFQNVPSYLTLFLGIFFANLLLLFGIMMAPLLDNFRETVMDSKIANYQYILKAPVSTSDADAEQYCLNELLDKPSKEEVMVYGISPDSGYFRNISEKSVPAGDEILISEGYSEKYGYLPGDEVTLKEKFSSKSYSFRVKEIVHYPASLAVFMNDDLFRRTFDKEKDYFTGYLTDRRLTDVKDAYIASVITEHDLVVIADQLDDSMGLVFPIIGGFATLLYMLMIYMLSKLILEKNAKSISMTKILGYSGRETGRLYISPTAWVVMISLVVTLPLAAIAMRYIYNYYMLQMKGWLTFFIAPATYVRMLLIGVVSYFVVSAVQYLRIRRIPMEQALKNNE
ncbi:MAG: FtsX-like permease family protein [Clostridia bacterium]|nr:FtsX-like permease family protein [Clostridia bacterium]